MSKIKASDIGLRVVALEKQFEIQGKRRDGFWEEFQVCLSYRLASNGTN